MTMQFRAALFLSVAACGSSTNNGNNMGTVDAPAHSPGDAPQGTDDASMPADAGPPADGAVEPSGVFAIPLSTPTGDDQGEFYTPSLTASGKTFLLDLDTGSTVTGIAGTGCTTCTGMSPLYAPAAGATATGKTDSAQYADGSGWSGSVYADKVGLGHGSPDVTLDFVDITAQMGGFFAGNEYQGILGMGPGALLDPGTTAYPAQVVAAGVTDVMAFELCPTDGTMWLGGFDPSHTAATPKYTPILTTGDNAAFYSVNMTAMTLGTTNLGTTSATFDGPIVDTGTSLFYIPSATETALIKDINASAGFKAIFTGQTLTDPTNDNSQTAGCVTATNATAATVDAMLPQLSFTFAGVGGGSITVGAPATATYFYDAGGGQFCLGIFGGGDQGNMTMGDIFMRAFVTVIDVAHKQVGFAPTSHCAAPAFRNPHKMREAGRGPHRH